MCFMSSPSTPPVEDPVDPPEPPKEADEEVQRARDLERRQARLAAGRSSTVLTGGRGLTGDAAVQRKTLLGQ